MIKSLAELLQVLKGQSIEQKIHQQIHGAPADNDYGEWYGVPMVDKRDLMKAVMNGQALKGEGGTGGKIVRVTIDFMPDYHTSVTRQIVFIRLSIVTHNHRIVTLGGQMKYDYWHVEDTRKGMTRGFYEFVELVEREICKIDFLADEKKELAKQALQNLAIEERKPW